MPNSENELIEAEREKIVQSALRIIEQRWQEKGDIISNPESSKDYFRLKLSHEKQEVFSVIYLDSKHRVIKYEALFRGTIDSAAVYPRVVVQKGLEHNAAAMIVAHNHPSGLAEPSRADAALTEQLKQALNLLNIRLLDHLVIGESDTVSFAERGLI